MRILVTGICGFVGSSLARALQDAHADLTITGVDNFSRAGSAVNRPELARRGIAVIHGDVRSAADLDTLPDADWVIDAAANPSVLAGVDGRVSARQVLEHNLWGTVNVLEYCRARRAGLILLSTSRVYSMTALAALPLVAKDGEYRLAPGATLPAGVSGAGVSEAFSTEPPLSLYGSTKLASEVLALEYAHAFDVPVWIDRCGILAGAGQFGRPDQGIVAYWINAHLRRRALTYTGFSGTGSQVRDCLHPRDLATLVWRQVSASHADGPRVQNCGGGIDRSFSLARLTAWCDARFGAHPVRSDPTPRTFDIPWMIVDAARASARWDWKPSISLDEILEEIARHAEAHPEWLELSAGG